MSRSNHGRRIRGWYIAHEILYFEINSRGIRGQREFTVWENLILIRAKNRNDAYRKAIERGRLNEQPVKIDGEDGYCRFKGLRDLYHVYDALEDGGELEWREFRVKPSQLDKTVLPKAKMQAFRAASKEPSGKPISPPEQAARQRRRKARKRL